MARFKDRVGVVSTNGFFQEAPSAVNSNSTTGASRNSAIYVASLPLVFGSTTAYTIQLPSNALILEFDTSIQTGFDASTTIKAGTSVGAADLLAAKAFVATTDATDYACLKPVGIASSTVPGTVYVTINQTTTVGAGYFFVRYILPAVAVTNANL